MDSESNTVSTVPEGEASRTQAAYVSAVSFVTDGGEDSVRFIVGRDLNESLGSFSVSYKFTGQKKDGRLSESRYFTLCYDREGINTKETVSIRMKTPDGYNAVGCSAFVSRIVYSDGREESFSEEDGISPASCVADRIKPDPEERKKVSEKVRRTVIISLSALIVIGLAVGGIFLGRYLNVTRVINELLEAGRYGEAYMIAGECGGNSLRRTVCGNIITKALGEKDYKTAYIYSSFSGREDTVFKRVEYELRNSGASALEGDVFTVLKKNTNDEEFDRTLKGFITVMCDEGNFPAAVTAASEIRDPSERDRMLENLVVDGVCWYSANSPLHGMAKYDKALEFFHFYETGDHDRDRDAARDIVDRCFESGDCAGAIVLSYYFGDCYDDFGIDPTKIEITPHNKSISLSLDYAYPLLTDEQKRAYHADALALSEEAYIIRNGTIAGSDVKNAVSVSAYENRAAVLLSDGKVVHLSNNKHNTVSSVPDEVNGVQIAVGEAHTVILNADGTVTAVGDNSRGQCNTGEWRDIVEIAAGRNFTLGLRSDGTLVACGSDKCGQCIVGAFANVISVEACDQTSVLLFRDGTVALRGECSMGLYKASKFTNVEQVKAGGSTVIVRYSDGTFGMADGSVNNSCGDITAWNSEDITEFAAGSQCIAYFDKNGRVNITGDGAPK